jgi:hypothetical protein
LEHTLSSTSSSSNGIAGILNEFIKGAVWGFVAFVHVALITVLTYRFTLNCLPAQMVDEMNCLAADCPKTCDPSNDFLFYILSGMTVIALMLLPLGFGIYRVLKSSVFSEPQNPI